MSVLYQKTDIDFVNTANKGLFMCYSRLLYLLCKSIDNAGSYAPQTTTAQPNFPFSIFHFPFKKRSQLSIVICQLSILLSFVNCVKVDVIVPGEIVLRASVKSMNDVTRTVYNNTNFSAHPLDALVPASLTDGDYARLYCSGIMTFDGNAMGAAYNKPVEGNCRYPNNIVPIYLSGLYPSAGWTGAEGVWTFTLTGKEDVMFAPQVSTILTDVWNNRCAVLEFAHQLTLMRLWVYADREVAARIRLKTIRLVKAGGSHLPTAVTVSLNGTQTVSFAVPERPALLDCYIPGTDKPYVLAEGSEYPVTTTVSEQAYILAPPVLAGDAGEKEYAFVISYLDGTNQEKTQQVDIDLKHDGIASFNGTTAAHAFSITFRFAAGGQIVPRANLTNWLPGGEYEVN
jgi:hypothetical protein